MAEIEETVRDTALSLIGVESLDNDEPLMDAGTLDHEFSPQKAPVVAVSVEKTKTDAYFFWTYWGLLNKVANLPFTIHRQGE